MKKKLFHTLPVFLLIPVLLLSGCSFTNQFGFQLLDDVWEEFETPSQTKPDSPMEAAGLTEEQTKAYLDFSILLLKQSVKEGENTLISPASAEFALTMALMGADGETLNEMLSVLYKDFTKEEAVASAEALNNQLMTNSKVTFHIANSVWVNESLIGDSLNNNYEESLRDKMYAQSFLLPFDKKAVDNINKWVSRNTDNMIPALLDDINPDVAMYLINAMCFEAKWSTQYKKYQIQDKVFTNAAGEEEQVNMLCETSHNYLENDKACGFLKYYEDADYAFMAMLPKEEGSLEDFVANMTTADYTSFYNSLNHEYDVRTELPCFSYSYEINLNDALKEMGMTYAFDETQADFSPMTTDETLQLYIGNVLQKTYIDVNENGTRAAAVTSVEMQNATAALRETKEVILNRPFVYAIVNTKTGIPVFIGTVNNITLND